MIFKNAYVYTMNTEFAFDEESLNEKLRHRAFVRCGANQISSIGWTSPLGKNREQLCHFANGAALLSMKLEEKVLPSSVVNEMAEEKILEKEESEGRCLTRAEKVEIRDAVRSALLPKAFTKSKTTMAYVDMKEKLLVVDASSVKRAEELLALLRDCLGSLDVVPMMPEESPITTMTRWILGGRPPASFLFTNEIEMVETDGRGKVRCQHQDVSSDEVVAHIKGGLGVVSLGLNWDEKLSFVLKDDCGLRKIKFVGAGQEAFDEAGGETAEEYFDAVFALMVLQFRDFFPKVFEALGDRGEGRG